jgi:hypothetical protein
VTEASQIILGEHLQIVNHWGRNSWAADSPCRTATIRRRRA